MEDEQSAPHPCRRKTDLDCKYEESIHRHERLLRNYYFGRHAIAEYLVISAAACILLAEFYQYRAMVKIVQAAERMELVIRAHNSAFAAHMVEEGKNQQVKK